MQSAFFQSANIYCNHAYEPVSCLRLTWPPKVMAKELACWGMMSWVMWASVADGVTYCFMKSLPDLACNHEPQRIWPEHQKMRLLSMRTPYIARDLATDLGKTRSKGGISSREERKRLKGADLDGWCQRGTAFSVGDWL